MKPSQNQNLRINKRPASAGVSSVNLNKREKLKNLLIEKFSKKFGAQNRNLIQKEVALFINKEKLSEIDLKNFEFNLKAQIEDINNKNSQNSQNLNHELNILSKNLGNTNENNDTKSVTSKMSDISERNLSTISNQQFRGGLNYEDINNFELRQLLKSEKQVLKKNNLSKDEWTLIAEHKNKLWQENKKTVKEEDKMKKSKTRETYIEQMKEKENRKLTQQKIENDYHRNLMNNVDTLTKIEKKQNQATLEHKQKVKEMQDAQIIENINRKKNEFIDTRTYDNKLSK